MAFTTALLALLASFALGGASSAQQDEVTMIQQAAVPADRDVDVDTDDEASDASLLGQGVAVFAGIAQAMRYELAVRQTFKDDGISIVGDEAELPDAKCTNAERYHMNATVAELASKMLSNTKLPSNPEECPSDILGVAGLAVANTGFAPCMQKLLGVSQPCGECMLSFIDSARSCISKCVPMMSNCNRASAWFSDRSARSTCSDMSSQCLSCNNQHLKTFTQCSGAFATHRQGYYKFLDGVAHLMAGGNYFDLQKLGKYMVVQFGKETTSTD